MLYSEIKERENRFILSLKITLPFLFIVAFAILVFITNLDVKSLLKNNIIAFLTIIFLYVYYILYQIYMAFNNTIIDNTTKAFSKEYILKILDKEKDKNFSVILVKIENIEDINNRYGIKKTDELLYKFSFIMDEFLKDIGFKNNKIGHIVGGSFLILLEIDEKRAYHIFNQFINRIKNGEIDNIFLKILYTISPSRSENSAEELLIVLFDRLKEQNNDRRKYNRLNIKVSEFEKTIISSIKNRDFEFRYQPIKSVLSEDIRIYEILVRVISKKYGKFSQNQFISVVNRLGYELSFDIILVEEIFKIASLNKKKIFTINISSYSLQNSSFLNKIKSLYKEYNIQKDSIIFEINANNTLNDMVRLNENINILRELGIFIAIDNFGDDNTSFKYIKNINFDMVKFSIDFSKKYKDKKINEILKAFIIMFKALDIKTVVKFIENGDDYYHFKNLGVDYIQGYIVGRPMKELR